MERTYRIAVVLETFVEHARSMKRGIADYADHKQTWELYSIPIGRNHAAILNAALRADGIITRPNTDAMVEILLKAKKPTIALQYGENHFPGVGVNHALVAELAAEHLMAQGFRQFAYFGALGKPFSIERGRALQRAVNARGFPCHSFHGAHTNPEDFDWLALDPQLVEWLRQLPRPIGILCANDVVAAQLLHAAKLACVRVPDDAAVIGVDNDEMVCRFTSPNLSSIDSAGERIGFLAAELLDRMLHGENIERKVTSVRPTRLVVRQSSDVLAISDFNVADAVRYIRENASRHVCVDQVVDHVAVSRRTLEMSFRKLLGRSIQDEIMESRIRKAKQLLIETNMTIQQITDASGFCSRTHLSEIFKLSTGHAPAQYRRAFRTPRWTGNPSTNITEGDIQNIPPAPNAHPAPLHP